MSRERDNQQALEFERLREMHERYKRNNPSARTASAQQSRRFSEASQRTQQSLQQKAAPAIKPDLREPVQEAAQPAAEPEILEAAVSPITDAQEAVIPEIQAPDQVTDGIETEIVSEAPTPQTAEDFRVEEETIEEPEEEYSDDTDALYESEADTEEPDENDDGDEAEDSDDEIDSSNPFSGFISATRHFRSWIGSKRASRQEDLPEEEPSDYEREYADIDQPVDPDEDAEPQIIDASRETAPVKAEGETQEAAADAEEKPSEDTEVVDEYDAYDAYDDDVAYEEDDEDEEYDEDEDEEDSSPGVLSKLTGGFKRIFSRNRSDESYLDDFEDDDEEADESEDTQEEASETDSIPEEKIETEEETFEEPAQDVSEELQIEEAASAIDVPSEEDSRTPEIPSDDDPEDKALDAEDDVFEDEELDDEDYEDEEDEEEYDDEDDASEGLLTRFAHLFLRPIDQEEVEEEEDEEEIDIQVSEESVFENTEDEGGLSMDDQNSMVNLTEELAEGLNEQRPLSRRERRELLERQQKEAEAAVQTIEENAVASAREVQEAAEGEAPISFSFTDTTEEDDSFAYAVDEPTREYKISQHVTELSGSSNAEEDDYDEDEDEEYTSRSSRRRAKKAARSEKKRSRRYEDDDEDSDDYDDYDSEEDYDDYEDDDYDDDEDDLDDDDYAEHPVRHGFFRFLKWVFGIAIILVLVVIILNLLASMGRGPLGSMYNSVRNWSPKAFDTIFPYAKPAEEPAITAEATTVPAISITTDEGDGIEAEGENTGTPEGTESEPVGTDA